MKTSSNSCSCSSSSTTKLFLKNRNRKQFDYNEVDDDTGEVKYFKSFSHPEKYSDSETIYDSDKRFARKLKFWMIVTCFPIYIILYYMLTLKMGAF
jgi:hypothetical protein